MYTSSLSVWSQWSGDRQLPPRHQILLSVGDVGLLRISDQRQLEDSYSATLLGLLPRRHLGGPPGPSQDEDGDKKNGKLTAALTGNETLLIS